MNTDRFLNHPLLVKCERKFQAAQALFRQGDTGQTMFIIAKGSVQLVGRTGDLEYTVAHIQAGEFLGEKALVNDLPYRRAFSAVALSEVTAIEIGPSELALLEREAPYLIKLLLKSSFAVTERRLDCANLLSRILRSSDNDSRLLDCVAYLAETVGRLELPGIRLSGLVEALHAQIDMDRADIQSKLDELTLRAVLISDGKGDYILPDRARLAAYAAQVKQTKRAA